ncbi:hypothetical protein ACSBR1_008283 [Camellia fascicularis]
MLDSVSENGERFGDRVKQDVFRHFRSLYSKVCKDRPKLEGPFVSIGNEGVALELEVEFIEEEVSAAVKDCDENNVPRLNGFNLTSIQKNWKEIKKEIVQFMH